ncbi:hypothetical protein BH11BAC2_BH11BAC2_14530 [soil metagenome]
MKPEIPTFIENLFIGLVVAIFTIFINRIINYFPKKSIALLSVLISWLGFLVFYSSTDLVHDYSLIPPPFLLVIVPPLLFIIWFASYLSKRISLQMIPLFLPVIIQSFRILIEVILFALYQNGIIPILMTFEGLNYDILVGITAIPAGFLIAKQKMSAKTTIIWNIFGILLLVNIVVIAILSSPLPIRMFMNEPTNTIVFWFPFILLPGFVVPFALLMHVVSIRQNLNYGKA